MGSRRDKRRRAAAEARERDERRARLMAHPGMLAPDTTLPEEIIAACRYWDVAASEAANADYSIGLRLDKSNHDLIYVTDLARGQWSPARRDRQVVQCARLDGPNVVVLIEEEPGGAGKSLVDHYRLLLPGYAVFGVRPTKSKVIRAYAVRAWAESGRVRILRGAWNQLFLDELKAFPNGQNDDIVDGFSGAYNWLAAAPDFEAHRELLASGENVGEERAPIDEKELPQLPDYLRSIVADVLEHAPTRRRRAWRDE